MYFELKISRFYTLNKKVLFEFSRQNKVIFPFEFSGQKNFQNEKSFSGAKIEFNEVF